MPRFIILLALALSITNCSQPDPPTPERPNIVLIMADDLGYSDIGSFGGEIETPNLDRLASEGIRFTQFYNNAKCTESRAALLSGLYHHQSDNFRTPNHVTMAEVLKTAGYATFMSGKWHLPGNPVERGFDRYFGFLVGAVNFFTGENWGVEENPMRLDDQVFEVPESGFYTTDAFTDYAIEFLNEADVQQKPFFLYLPYNAPHFPLHALPEDIEKYRGKYKKGWDRLRAERYERMKSMDLIADGWALTPRDSIVAAWETLSDKEKDDEDLLMAVYAAMVDRLDQNIGRLLDHLEALGVAENTLVLFMSDNGACPYDFNRTPDEPPGGRDSYRTYDSEWANAGNTPFRLYKQWSHEGGIASPFIAHWPAGITTQGTTTDQVAHLIDLMPTLVELVGATYPASFNGHDILPMEGISLVPFLKGEPARDRKPVYWEYRGNRAVRIGPWKLVAERSMDWELYDMIADRSEVHNLINTHPERAAEMARLYDEWAARTGALSHTEGLAMGPSTQAR